MAGLDSDVLFLDTETTGLDGRAEIVELAEVNARGETLINTLARPASTLFAVNTTLGRTFGFTARAGRGRAPGGCTG